MSGVVKKIGRKWRIFWQGRLIAREFDSEGSADTYLTHLSKGRAPIEERSPNPKDDRPPRPWQNRGRRAYTPPDGEVE